MIAELKSIDLRAVATVATFDMGLQYDYITSEGAGTGFGDMGGWPAHILRPIGAEQWHRIRNAIKESALSYEDLEGTDLAPFVDNIHSMKELDINEALEGILELPEDINEAFYCFYDTGTWYDSLEKPMFFTSEAEVKEEFISHYVGGIEPWEDMTDEEIENWYERLNDDLQSFGFVAYDDE